jgi:hypothetical protein
VAACHPGETVRWPHSLVLAVLLGLVTGCPRDWAQDGTLDRAARKDNRERLKEAADCAPGESWQEVCDEDENGKKVCEMDCL